MTFATALQLALLASIFISVFALATHAHAANLAYLVTHWRKGLRAAAAIYLVVPAAAILMCLLFDFHPAVEIALVAVAFSPIPPVAPKGQLKAGASESYVTGLLLLASALALVVTPIGVPLAANILHADATVDIGKMAMTLTLSIAAPLVLGLIAGRVFGERINPLSEALRKLGGIMVGIAMLVWVGTTLPAMWAVIGNGTLIALIGIALVGLVAGQLLGGPDAGDRAALSLAASARNPGIAMMIATTNFPNATLAPPTILLSLILSSLISIPFLKMLDKN